MTVVTTVSHRYYMRKTKSDIITRICDMHEALKLGKPDLLKYNHWDKYSLAHEAMRLHRMFPPEPVTRTFDVPEEVLKEIRSMRMEWWKGVVLFRRMEQDASAKGMTTVAARHEKSVGIHLRRVQALNFFFPDAGDTAERDYERYKEHHRA